MLWPQQLALRGRSHLGVCCPAVATVQSSRLMPALHLGSLDRDDVTVLYPICRQAGQKSVFDPPLSKIRRLLCFRQAG